MQDVLAKKLSYHNGDLAFFITFKDFRTLLFFDAWLELVTDMKFIGIFLRPMVVERSLHARKKLPISNQEFLEIWKPYNQCLFVCYLLPQLLDSILLTLVTVLYPMPSRKRSIRKYLLIIQF